MAQALQSAEDVKVLAIASRVAYGYVGNKIATFVMQVLGCDVTAIDTVHFSNHTGYGQWRGKKVPAEEIQDLWQGLKQSGLDKFDMLLSGYTGSKDAVETIGAIAREQRTRSLLNPGSFFWLLDPVMGDNGALYVAEEIVPAYRALLPEADLILPNVYEAEVLAEMEIKDVRALVTAITKLHRVHRVPHVVVTSFRSPENGTADPESRIEGSGADTLSVVGSSCRSDGSPRIFSITVPRLPVYFSGTGDMFSALMAVRLRNASSSLSSSSEGEGKDSPPIRNKSWLPPDSVGATDLPLAHASLAVLRSMHAVLARTQAARTAELERLRAADSRKDGSEPGATPQTAEEEKLDEQRRLALRDSRTSELRVVQCADVIREPPEAEGVEGSEQKLFEVVPVDVRPDEKRLPERDNMMPGGRVEMGYVP